MGKEEEGTQPIAKKRKEEENGARPEQKDNSSGNAALLELRDSVRSAAVSQQDDVIGDAGSKDCEHFYYEPKEVYRFLEIIKGLKDDPQCVDCQRGATAENLALQEPRPRFMMCTGCDRCFCARLASNEDRPVGHAQAHAEKVCQEVALWIDQPYAAYCFVCGLSLSLEVIALAACSHELDYVVRGLPNSKGRCYVNSPLQCLLALDNLRMWMLGPHAPAGPIGSELKELFLETRSGNDARAILNHRKFLDSICPLDGRYRTSDHQDCHEFLVHLRSGLIKEEVQARLPNMPDNVPTVVDSIFRGKVSIMWTCKRCQHPTHKDEEFYELSLPLPPKEHPTKSVPASQRRGRRKRADTVRWSRQIQKEEEKKAAASLPSIKQCLEDYFRKEEVQKRCEICDKPSTSLGKVGGQMVANISESTSLDRAQAELDHHGKVEEKSNLLSDQDRTKQVELENIAQQVGEDPSKQISMGGPADKTLSLSKLPPVLTIHVLRFDISDKRSGHVKFEENLDVGEYLDPRSGERDARYRLVGVTEHLGRNATGGHFVAYVRRRIASEQETSSSEQETSSSSSSWFYADDDKDVREISLDQVLKCEAFLLFYEKRS